MGPIYILLDWTNMEMDSLSAHPHICLDYGILHDVPYEYMALMSKLDYSTITKYNEFKDYDYMASPSNN